MAGGRARFSVLSMFCCDSDLAVSIDVKCLLFHQLIDFYLVLLPAYGLLCFQQSFIGYLLMVSKLLRSCDVTTTIDVMYIMLFVCVCIYIFLYICVCIAILVAHTNIHTLSNLFIQRSLAIRLVLKTARLRCILL